MADACFLVRIRLPGRAGASEVERRRDLARSMLQEGFAAATTAAVKPAVLYLAAIHCRGR